MENLNAPAIPEGNRLMVLHSILDSVTAVEQEWPRSAISAVQKSLRECLEMTSLRFLGTIMGNLVELSISMC
ncbi:hypothetical protein LUQ84_003046 [Hamiltosporidium tvaerminnensis]|nr:hypothetical protein LUQ84_003046 [Hamiltosporidium tvaerminnensis]